MHACLLSGLLLVAATMTTPLAAQVLPAEESPGFHLNVAATWSPGVSAIQEVTAFGCRATVSRCRQGGEITQAP